jgi:enterochelin esterase-like enzyme
MRWPGIKRSRLRWAFLPFALLLFSACQPALVLTPLPTLASTCTEDASLVDDEAPSARTTLPITFSVYLPPCYASSDLRYPVLYILHGFSSGKRTWFNAGLSDLVTERIRAGQTPPFIIVAPTLPQEERTAESLSLDLVTYVDTHYRTLADRPYRVVAGGSLGAIFAARMVFRHPELFASVACFGGGMVHGEEASFRQWLAATPGKYRPRILIDIGQEDALLSSGELLAGLLDEANFSYIFNKAHGPHAYSYWMANLRTFGLDFLTTAWR